MRLLPTRVSTGASSCVRDDRNGDCRSVADCSASDIPHASAFEREPIVVVFLTGATGFIGSRLAQALASAGHAVICAGRSPGGSGACGRSLQVDFTRDHDAADWVPRLAEVDVVVNAVGILRERGQQSFEALHVRAPCALFEACVQTGVRRVVQVSALGADDAARSAYHLSKRTADERLLSMPLSSVVVQPSLVYGPGGTSARLFTLLASLPLIVVPGPGTQVVQPIHVDDLVDALVHLVEHDVLGGERVALVGPAPLALGSFLQALRRSMGMSRAATLAVPAPLMRRVAQLGSMLPGSLLDPESLDMLDRGNAAPATATQALLGRPPRPAEAFIEPRDAQGTRMQALSSWTLPLLRWSIAAVWIFTGIVSLGVYPVPDSLALLARVGLTGVAAWIALYGAALLDLAFGVAIIVMKAHRRLLWLAQIALVLGYTALITLWLPEYWLHPYGPVLKNLPFIAALVLLWAFEPDRRRWNT